MGGLDGERSVQERGSAGGTMQSAVPVVLRLCDDGSQSPNHRGLKGRERGSDSAILIQSVGGGTNHPEDLWLRDEALVFVVVTYSSSGFHCSG
jgi:hypothetical protein